MCFKTRIAVIFNDNAISPMRDIVNMISVSIVRSKRRLLNSKYTNGIPIIKNIKELGSLAQRMGPNSKLLSNKFVSTSLDASATIANY